MVWVQCAEVPIEVPSQEGALLVGDVEIHRCGVVVVFPRFHGHPCDVVVHDKE